MCKVIRVNWAIYWCQHISARNGHSSEYSSFVLAELEALRVCLQEDRKLQWKCHQFCGTSDCPSAGDTLQRSTFANLRTWASQVKESRLLFRLSHLPKLASICFPHCTSHLMITGGEESWKKQTESAHRAFGEDNSYSNQLAIIQLNTTLCSSLHQHKHTQWVFSVSDSVSVTVAGAVSMCTLEHRSLRPPRSSTHEHQAG